MARNLTGWIIAGAAIALAAGESSACSLTPQHQPLRLTQEQIDDVARRLLAEPGITIAEAVVVRSTAGQRGLLRVDRVLRGDPPATLEVRHPICGYGFLNVNERGLLVYGDQRPLRHFLHRQIEEAVRRIVGSE